MTTTLATKRAVGYLRVSSTGQIGERHSSLETQEARYHEYCIRNNYTPVATFVDVVSGRRDDRKEYNRMVEFVKADNADVIVVQYLDRFGRNPKEILRLSGIRRVVFQRGHPFARPLPCSLSLSPMFFCSLLRRYRP